MTKIGKLPQAVRQMLLTADMGVGDPSASLMIAPNGDVIVTARALGELHRTVAGREFLTLVLRGV
jgi:hypothetical protein